MENKAKIITAKVLKTAMDKSAVVSVERLVKHPVNGKFIKRSTKYHVHDENNKCVVGELIKIKQCRPISKTKSWVLVEE
jgi:small subunit ribosomal protein S17|tara:strand:+ start:106 stop:342 length:237 start_codon:yes stop_codon:yes gene_type:complete